MTALLWIGFILLILVLLSIDLFVINRKSHIVRPKEAITWTFIWVGVSLLFNVLIYFLYEYHWLGIGLTIGHELSGKEAALNFFTGYLIEKSLSLDNIFVIALIFGHFRVPAIYQHRVLFWGILGAMLFRGILIACGSVLIARFDWIVYVFGALLIFTAVKLLIEKNDLNMEESIIIRMVSKLFTISSDYDGNKFFTKVNDRHIATPLFLALLVVETADVVFAIDSIPAIFAITYDPFLVFTSNVFAILGLRSLYFALAFAMNQFKYMKVSLVFILSYVGVKILLTHYFPIPPFVSLAIISGILSIGIFASIFGIEEKDVRNAAFATLMQVKRVIVVIVGTTIMIAGIAMIVLPGPSLLVILLGLAILGTEFRWARKLMGVLKQKVQKMRDWFKNRRKN